MACPAWRRRSVVVLGGGVVGTHAIEIALGMGARVTVLDRSVDALKRLWTHYGPSLQTVFSTADAIERHVATADLVIGGVLVAGAAAPKLVTRSMIATMQPGSVVVDVAIDQGGCFETSHATTHADPTYVVDGVVHYCVANMPGGVPRTSTFALNNVTLPFVVAIADKGWKRALADDVHLRQGLNVAFGQRHVPACRRCARLRVDRSGFAAELTPQTSNRGAARSLVKPVQRCGRTATTRARRRAPAGSATRR